MANRLIIIAGASGTGKTTVSNYLKEQYGIPQIVTHTTRPMRDGEVDGKHYHFESPKSFEEKHMIEHVTYSGYRYGSSQESLDSALSENHIASIVLDTVGVKTYLKCVSVPMTVIFLTVKDEAVLRKRLLGRGDAPERVEARLNSAESKRDLVRPDGVQNAIVIDNSDWDQTRIELDNIVKGLGAKARKLS